MKDQEKDPPKEAEQGGISQIPLLKDVVFDAAQPLKTPRSPARKKKPVGDHGPDYDPDTLDLFEEPSARFLSYVNDHTKDEVRDGAGQVINDLVDEYSLEITRLLRDELNEQLQSILQDLSDGSDNPSQDD